MVNVTKKVGKLNTNGKKLKGSNKRGGLYKFMECKIKRLGVVCLNNFSCLLADLNGPQRLM